MIQNILPMLWIQEKGFEIVPIIDLIHKDNYYMDHEGRQVLKES